MSANQEQRVWSIGNFDDGPHWCESIIVADSEQAACDLLAARLAEHSADAENYGPKHIETVWHPQPREQWRVRELEGSILLILGCGCR